MIFQLNKDDLWFPDPELAEPDGLLAIGGDLDPQRLIHAYQEGIFPWFSEDEEMMWFSPQERCVIFPGKIKVSKSMAALIRKEAFQITFNQDFSNVIRHCAEIERRGQDGTWITRGMIAGYSRLYEQGVAQSIEVWEKGILVGGLYGLVINRIFCGESMFSLRPNASKYALIALCRSGVCKLIDCQIPNDHLRRMGAEIISGKDFRALLKG
jgi:leucyl/phenylalanyl-tRNA--protein transferase